MLSSVRRIGKKSLFYALAQASSGAVSFILIPIYGKTLPPSEFGVIAIVGLVVSIYSILCEMGMASAIVIFYYDHRQDPDRLKTYISTILWFLLPFGALLTILLAFFSQPLFAALTGDVPFSPFILLALGIGFCRVFFDLMQSLNQAQERAELYAGLAVAFFSLNLGLIVYFVLFQQLGALGNTIAQAITSALFLFVAFIVLRHWLVPRFNRQDLRESLKFGLPIIPHSLSGWIINAVDRLFLTHYSGLTNVGIYTLGSQLGFAIRLVTSSINLAWAPFFMGTAKEKGEAAKPLFSRLITYYLLLILFLALGLSLFAPEIVRLLSSAAYQEAYRVIPLIAFGNVFDGMYYMVVNQIFYTKKTLYVPLATFSAGFLQILLNFLWTPTYGMIGAACAVLASQAWMFLVTWFFSFRVYPLHFEYGRIIRLILVSGVILGTGLMIDFPSLWITILSKTALLIAFFLLLRIGGFFQPAEIQHLRQLVAPFLNRFSGDGGGPAD